MPSIAASLLSIAGLLLYSTIAVARLSPWAGELRETACYLAVGLGCAALILYFDRIKKSATLTYAFGVLTWIALFFFRGGSFSFWMVGASAVSAALIEPPERRDGDTLMQLLAGAVVGCCAWMAFSPWIWWNRLDALQGQVTSLGAIIALATVFSVALGPWAELCMHRYIDRAWTACALVVFFLLSARQCVIKNEFGFYAGAVDLARAGGKFLWDIPSQYGFLHIFLASLLPVHSGIEAVYLANSACIFVSAALLYFMLKDAFRGVISGVIAFVLVFCGVYFVPGWALSLNGPHGVPSAGAFRFLPVYLILAHFWWRKARSESSFLFLGTLLWLLGALWSAEVFFFATVTWIPIFLFRKNRHAMWMPPVFLTTCWGFVELFYLLRFGHGLDWKGFVEFPLAYGAGYGALPIDLSGAVSSILWVFSVLVFGAVFSPEENSQASVAALGACWSTAAYFVSRSHDNNIMNLAPIHLAAVALVLRGLRVSQTRFVLSTVKMALIPYFSLIVTVVILGRGNLSAVVASIRQPIRAGVAGIEFGAAPLDDEAQALMKRASYNPSDPLAYFGLEIPVLAGKDWGQTPIFLKPWIAIEPTPEFGILPRDRQILYVERWLTEHHDASAWILVSKPLMDSIYRIATLNGVELLVNPAIDLIPIILRKYSQKSSVESAHWRLIHFEKM